MRFGVRACARALNNSISHSELFGMPVLRAISVRRGSPRLSISKDHDVLALVGAVLLAMLLIQINMDLEANGSLQPVTQYQVFAHIDGEVRDVLVDHGDEVQAGQLLVTLQNRDLEIEIASLQGQREETLSKITALNYQVANSPAIDTRAAIGNHSREWPAKRSQKATRNTRRQACPTNPEQQRLNVVSPISELCGTWDLKKNLRARPVMKGNVLVTVADPRGDYEVELLCLRNA